MCGLTGIWFFESAPDAGARARILASMRDTLTHRGPDDDGVWFDAEAGFGLGFRRLAIVDLTPSGHQPMPSQDGRYVVAFNGEIYNHGDLRRELSGAGCTFKGTSDTEVVVEAIARWGVHATLERLNGMFAIAIWDRAQRALHLVRDRLGIKPLYWSLAQGRLLFGSELKALRACPGFAPSVDRGAMAAYLRLGYVPAPHSIYGGVSKVQPGTRVTIGADARVDITTFWSLDAVIARGQARRRSMSDEEAVTGLESLLRDAIGKQMLADVPLGAFLSGGIDSSTVVALMQAQSDRPVRTFTIGFAEAGYDEAGAARAVAAHLGTEHTELRVEPRHALEVIPRLATHHDEPFADSSQIPTALLCELTRRSVTVALSGDGGDELFAGYERYALAEHVWGRVSRIPGPLRALLAGIARGAASPLMATLLSHLPKTAGGNLNAARLTKLAAALSGSNRDDLYRQIVSNWGHPERLLPGVTEVGHPLLQDRTTGSALDYIDRMRELDLRTYLPDDILTKVDRASMAVSLEARVPLLDHRVVEYAWTLPRPVLVREGAGKWLLRQVLYRHVPRALVDRPKMGFAVPIDVWLRGPLRAWAEDLLSVEALARTGLEPRLVRMCWEQHVSGRQDWHYPIWNILMLQAWTRRWGTG